MGTRHFRSRGALAWILLLLGNVPFCKNFLLLDAPNNARYTDLMDSMLVENVGRSYRMGHSRGGCAHSTFVDLRRYPIFLFRLFGRNIIPAYRT